MPKEDPRRQFPPNAKSNPGRKDERQSTHKEKLIQNPSRGPKSKKSKSKA